MDIQLLGSMLNRRAFELLEPSVPKDLVAAETVNIMRWLGAFYRANPEVNSLSVNELKAFITLRSTKATPEQLELTLAIADKIRVRDSSGTASLLNTLNELTFAGRVGAAVVRYDEGGEIDLINTVREYVYEADQIQGTLGLGVDETPLDELLTEAASDTGVKLLGMPQFSEQIDLIRGGVSVAFCGRPDSGKTSSIARIVSDTAKGCAEFFGFDRPILWLINEGDVKRARTRVIQAGPRMTLKEVAEMNLKGEFVEHYREVVGVPIDYIKVAPIYGWNTVQIERLIEKENPSLVVIDMLEHVHISGSESKTEKVNDLWVWTRESALRHNYISIATTQIGADGANMLFPDITHLHYSRTGIQAATDIVIMLGMDAGRVGLENIRGISTPKNKFKVEGKSQIIKTEVDFDMDRCDFKGY